MVQRRVAVDASGQIGVGHRVFRPRQLARQGQQLRLRLGRRRVQARQRIQHPRLELRPLLAGEGQVDAVVGAALGDERHGAEQRIDAHLDPAPVLDEGLFQQGVVDVVPRIALVTA
ncbi:hypothetical protein D9M72_609590 [compost metagenome]